MLKIKLLKNVPVEKKHGMSKGRILEAIINPTEIKKIDNYFDEYEYGRIVTKNNITFDFYEWFYKGKNYFWVQGDAGEAIKIWDRECEIIKT